MLKQRLALLALPLVFSLTMAATAQEGEPVITPLTDADRALFDYEADVPVLTEVGTETRGTVMIKDVTYPSPVDGEPIAAYLVVPEGEGPFPVILYVHWYESTSPDSNRTQFVEEAVGLAQDSGVMSLLVETMWSEPTWYREGRTLDSDYDDTLQQVIELRRGLDVLLAQPGADADRVAYVGHDFGAMYGSVMAGVDDRPDAYVLIAAASNFNQWMLFGMPDDQAGLDEYKATMDTLAPTRFIHAVDVPVLFQFGTVDFYTPGNDVFAYFNAANAPKTIELYESGHEMTLEGIQADRLAFLREQLGLE